MNLMVFKGIIFAGLAALGMFFSWGRKTEQKKSDAIVRVEQRLEKMRALIDDIYGEGAYDRMSEGKFTEEEIEAINMRFIPAEK